MCLFVSWPQESQSEPSNLRSVTKCLLLTGKEFPKPTATYLGGNSLDQVQLQNDLKEKTVK